MDSRALEQIDSLQQEKLSRTPAQKKLDSQLVYALRERHQRAAVTAVQSLRPALQFEADGRLLLDIRAEVAPALLESIRAGGGLVVSSFPKYNAVRALVPLDLVEALAKDSIVRWVRPADRAATSAVMTAFEGDIAHRADQARRAFRADGTGIKIGVLSDSVDYLAQLQASGQLPNVNVLPGQGGIGTGEGTAMLQIVHNVAPGSDLYFATAFDGVASFSQNIRDLQAAGCRVIIDDVVYFNESPFQNGPIAQAVNDVSAAGALYFSAAGNSGSIDHGTAGSWEGDFSDAGPATFGRGGRVHNFGGSLYDTVVAGGGLRRIDLFWSDPLGASTNDYDVYILDSANSVVRSSTNIQDGNADPYETIPVLNVGERIVIVKFSGENRFLHLSTGRAVLAIATCGTTLGHNAAPATNAFCVAATRVSSPPQPFVGGSANPVETFSSDGPRRIFFEADGSPVTPRDFSSTGGRVIQKPDFTAADGVSTSVPGFSSFFGTSAAAPHAGAIAALLWSFNPLLSPGHLASILRSTALDIEGPGTDRDSGAGVLDAYGAFSTYSWLQVQDIQIQDANGNHSLDANECADLAIQLQNTADPTNPPLRGITAVLTCSTPGVVVDPAPRFYPDMPASSTAISATPFRISTTPLFNCGTNATFRLLVTASNDLSFAVTFDVNSSMLGVGNAVSFASTSAPIAIPDLGSVVSPVAVSGINLPLARTRVKLYITHTYDYDLRLSLVAPDGTEVLLSSNNGDNGQNYGASCQDTTVFSDDASNSIAAASAPFVGVFTPQQPLSVFNGRSGFAVNGTWNLKVEDQVSGDTGTLQCWALELAPIACADGGGECLVGPGITQSPTNQQVLSGDPAEFVVAVNGTDPLSYQWFFNGTNVLRDATNALLVLNNVAPQQAGAYSVIVRNPYGAVTSAPALLSVTLMPPAILSGPSNLQRTNGDTAGFAVTAQGSKPLAYQWYFQGAIPLSGATSASLILPAVTLDQAGSYTVVVTNLYGSATSSPAQLQVVVPATIIEGPTNQLAFQGATAQFAVFAQGTEPVSYQWFFNETNALVDGTNALLVLGNLALEQSGGYSVLVSNPYGNATSAPALLTVVAPPQITRGPADLVLTNGQGAEFDVTATGTEPLSYQWYFQGEPVLGATTNLFALISVKPGDAGSYAVSVSNPYGSVTSAPAQLTVLSAPWIVADPTNRVATNGATVQLNVNAAGTEPLAYQWYFNETNSLAEGTNATLVLSNVVVEQAGSYSVTVSNLYGSATSAPAVLTVVVPPQIVTGPTDQVVTNGHNAQFSVTAQGTEPLSYQWYFQATQTVAGATTHAFGGGTVSVLTLPNVTPAQAGAYSVAVTSPYGSVTSAPAQLIVLSAPWIVADATNQVVTNGGTVQLTVNAAGTEPLAYQWYFNDTNSLAEGTNATLVLSNVVPGQAGSYSVTVSNLFGGVTSAPAVVTVVVPPQIVSGPADQVATNGTGAQFSVTAQGTEPLNYQWYFQGAVLAGATDALLMLTAVSPAQAGAYAVVVSNPYGAVTSAPAQLVVLSPPFIVSEPTNQVATNGDRAEMTLSAAGTEPLAYQWYFNETNSLIEGTNASLVLSNVVIAQGGSYSVTVSNLYGSATSAPAVLTVVVPPQIVTGPSDQVATNGAGAQFSVTAQGTEPLSYQWYFQSAVLAGATEALLTLTAVTPFQAGGYAVVVSNPYGSVTSAPAQLVVLSPPLIVSGPTNQVATNGGTVEMTVGAAGTEPLAYQWYFNETNSLAEGTNATLVLSNVVVAQGGSYSVTVSNLYGSVTSAPAVLTVVVPPQIVTGPSDQVATNGAGAQFSVSAQGSDPLSYQWYFKTEPLTGATDTLLTLTAVTPLQAGGYAVVVSNPYGSVTSAPAQLVVLSPPLIVSSPTNQVATNGDRVEMTVSAAGTEPLAYQWYFNETNSLAEGTNASLVLSNVVVEQAGSYSVTVSNLYGSATSAPALLTVVVPPQIVTGPSDQVATNGAGAQFSVTAQGTEPLSYQWYFQSAVLAGATDALLTLTSVTPLQAGGYAVVVSSPYGSVTSAPAQLVVLSPPLIVSSPTNTVATNGDVVEMSVSAVGTEPLVYQWFFNETNSLAEGTNATLVLSNAMPEQAGSYLVTVSNLYGSATSAPAVLTVVVPPQIVTGPGDQVVTNGEGAQFSVSAQGTEPLNYQWYFQSAVLAGATDALLTLEAVSPAQAGAYAVVVSNPYGALTSAPARLTVLAAPFIVTDPTNQVATNGDTVHLAVTAVGTEPLVYQWYFNQTNSLAEGTNATLVLSNVVPEQAGNYSVTVSNLYGSATSAPAVLTVVVPPQIVTAPSDQVVTSGQSAQFDVSARGSDPLSYQWYFQATALNGATDASLTLGAVSFAQAGSYAVAVSNPYGSVTSPPAQLVVLSAPFIVSAPTNQVATNGDRVEIAVSAAGTEPLAYQWYFNETNSLAEGTNATLVLSNVVPEQAGSYSVTVTNLYGSATSAPAVLTVVVPPQILSGPADQVVTNGQSAQFGVSAQGTEPLSYQWYFQGQPLAGATNTSFVLLSTTPADAGPYAVSVSNAYGSVTSAPARLTVLVPAAILAGPTNQVVIQGSMVQLAVIAQGTPPLAYQWYFNGTNALAQGTNAVYTITNVAFAHGGTYSVMVSNALASAVSGSAVLRVLVPPTLLSLGRAENVFTITFSTEPGLLYTIYFDDILPATNWTVLPKAFQRVGTGTPMTVQDPKASTAQRYYKIVVE